MKLKNHIGSIFFLIAASASAAYGVVTERAGGAADRERAESRVFASFDRSALTEIEIERTEGRLVLVRTQAADAFRMKSPEVASSDAASVDQLVAALELATVVRRVTEPLGAAGEAEVGRGRARGTLRFGDKVVRFTLGGPAPVPEGGAYLEVEGGGQVVIARELALELMRPFDAYRDRTLVPVTVNDIVHFDVKSGERTVSLERLDDASFRIPGGTRASRELTDRWISAVPELRAVTFVHGEAAKVDAITHSLTVTARDGRAFVVRFGGACPGSAADVMATVDVPDRLTACVPRVIAAAFDVAPALVGDGRLFLARPDETSEISLEVVGNGTLSLARVGSGFRERLPRARDLDAEESDAATALVSRWLAVSGALVGAPALGPVALRVAVGRVGTDVLERIELVDVGTAHFAHRLADGAWLSLTAAARRALEPPLQGVRATALVGPGFTVDSAQRIVVKCGATAETLVRKEGSFVLEAPHGLPADTSRALGLLELVAKSRAREVTVDAAASKAKEGCSLTLGWTADGGALESTLSFRARDDDAGAGPSDVLVQREGQRGEREWLVVDDAIERALEEPLVDRGAIGWSAEPSERITLVRGEPTRFDEARWRSALRDLRATRVDRLGPSVADEGFAAPLLEFRLTKDAAAPVTIRFSRAHAPGELLVRRSDLDVTFRVPDDAVPAGLLSR